MPDLKSAISRFGADAKAKLANPGVTGEPEDQLRNPLEGLFGDLAELCGLKREWLTVVGESALSTLKTRPDFAITLRNVLVGFVEVKATGQGRRSAPVQRTRQGAMGEAAVAPESALHRRQRLQSLARR